MVCVNEIKLILFVFMLITEWPIKNCYRIIQCMFGLFSVIDENYIIVLKLQKTSNADTL